MSPMTSALISYWHRLPAESPVARRRTLDTIRDRVRAGLEPPTALVPFALGDADDGIVAAATQAYVTAATAPAGAGTTDAAIEAAEWVRRSLALNRGAVFGALLALEDERGAERLAALRLLLSAAEVDAACRVLGASPGPHALAFLRDWLDLIAEGPRQQERRLITAALEAARGVRAA